MDESRLSLEQMAARVVRYADLRPCYNAFIDSRSPGSEAKENFTIIGPGVAENPAQHVHIAEPHGFNIGGARQPPGCVNSQHSHDTAEVFVVHSGEWRFDLGEHGDDAQVHCAPGDVIALPTGVFRGFTATAPAANGSPGFLWAVLGGDDPGRVLWAPQVFEMAADHGLVLLENGTLVDIAAGERVPAGVRPMTPTSGNQVAALHVPSQAEAESLVWRADGKTRSVRVIASDGAITAPHPFTLERLVDPEMTVTAAGPDVWFVHSGTLDLAWRAGALKLAEGDTVTLPPGIEVTLSGAAKAYRVQSA